MLFNNNNFRTILQCDRGAKEVDLAEIKSFYHKISPHLSKLAGDSKISVSFRIAPGDPYFYINSYRLDNYADLHDLDFLKIIKCNSDAGIVYACGDKEPSHDTIKHYEIYLAQANISAIISWKNPDGENIILVSTDLDSLYKECINSLQ